MVIIGGVQENLHLGIVSHWHKQWKKSVAKGLIILKYKERTGAGS